MDDDKALAILQENLEGTATADPNYLRFVTGRRKKAWNKNCVSIGLSSGFLEPLESTSIHLIQLGIMKLMEFFPDKHCDSALSDEYNRMMSLEFERLRDFLVLHYTATERDDSEFWNYCRQMEKPEGLEHKMALFRERGHVVQYTEGLFLKASWLAVYLGQGFEPEYYDWAADNQSPEKIAEHLRGMKGIIARTAHQMPSHSQSLAKHCDIHLGRQTPPPPASMSLYGRGH